MSITATFYTFSKRTNSTKIPGATAHNYSINLKEPFNITGGQILLKADNPTEYNYAYISYFERYYFVEDWTSDHGLWMATISVDTLATYKTEILNSSQFVLRAGSVASGAGVTSKNAYLIDGAYPMTKEREDATIILDTPFDAADPTWGDLPTYVLGLVNNSDQAATKIHGVQYLQLTRAQARKIFALILNQDYFGLGSVEPLLGITPAVLKTIMNPCAYISESYILPLKSNGTDRPFDKTVVSSGSDSIRLGWWTVPVSDLGAVYSVSGADNASRVNIKDIKFKIDAHPQSITHGAYLNYSPYTRATLYAGPFGQIPLDISDPVLFVWCRIVTDFKGNSTLYIKEQGDSSDWDSTENHLITLRKTNVATQIPVIEGKTPNPMGALSATAGMAAGAVTTGGASLALSGGNIVDAVSNMMPKYYEHGGLGSDAFIKDPWAVNVEYNLVAGDTSSANLIGSPLCDNRQLSDLTGFCQVSEPSLNFAALKAEKDLISSFLTGGFFIE